MRKITKLYFALSVMLVGGASLASCTGEKSTSPEEQVRNYGKYFVEKVAAGQLDSLKVSFPSLAQAEGLVDLQSDTILVAETAPGSFDVTIRPGVILRVNRAEDGTISVIDSKGLFRFPEEKYGQAIESGMFNDSIDDSKKQALLNDNDYFDWLKRKMTEKASNSIKLSMGKERIVYWTMAEGFDSYMPVTLTNTTDQPISGNDYNIAYTLVQYWGTEGDTYSSKKTRKGVDLEPGASKTIELKEQVVDKYKNMRIDYKNKSANRPSLTGNEYQEYLDSKK